MQYESLPPILTTRGLRLVAWGEDNGRPWFKFAATTRTHVREVVVYVTSDKPVRVRFEYAIYDPQLKAVRSYRGRYGNPERDRFVGMLGVEPATEEDE